MSNQELKNQNPPEDENQDQETPEDTGGEEKEKDE
jgi:hypothetical protein